MDLPAFRAAALAAMTLSLIVCSVARADEGSAQADLGTAVAEQPATVDTPAAPVVEGINEGAQDEIAPGGTPQEPAPETTPAEPQALPQDGVEPLAPSSPEPGPTSVSTPAGGPEPASDPLAPGGTAAASPAEPLDELPTPPPAAPSSPAPAFTPLADGNQNTGGLLGVTHELRKVRMQIDDLQRRLDAGAPLPPTQMIRLRSRLERIAPVLLVLEARLKASGRLSSRVRELLRRVHVRLSGARVSASRLADSLRRSGEGGRELQLLLSELEHFRALGAGLATTLRSQLGPTPPLEPGAYTAYLEQAQAASPSHAATVRPEHSAGRPAARSPAGGSSGLPPPWSSAPGSASASSGGAFFAAGLAGLAALLIGLVPPLLRSRLLPPHGSRRMVAFLTPLERPG